jgi:N-acetylmuramoyl-L-alanine amidase
VEPIQRGGAGREVEDVQRRLADLGLACADDPGVFDAATEAAVRTFQQQRGLTADGIVGPDTWWSLVGASFRLGDRILYTRKPLLEGDDVRELQRRLNRLGFDAGYDDGIYGDQTVQAVREFQLNVGLNVDGIAGPSTFDLLTRLHRQHQEAAASAVREREALRRPPRASVAGTRIMVDPGHSPDLPGLNGPDGIREHEITWQIATLLEGRLSALGAHVILSRGPNTSPTPSERARNANAESVEVILSIHANGNSTPAARGVAAYHFGTDVIVSDRGRFLAEVCVDRLAEATGSPNCRAHASTTAILRESRAPAVIVEPGFLTHPEEGRLLASPDHQRLIAGTLAGAVVTFLVEAPALVS